MGLWWGREVEVISAADLRKNWCCSRPRPGEAYGKLGGGERRTTLVNFVYLDTDSRYGLEFERQNCSVPIVTDVSRVQCQISHVHMLYYPAPLPCLSI